MKLEETPNKGPKWIKMRFKGDGGLFIEPVWFSVDYLLAGPADQHRTLNELERWISHERDRLSKDQEEAKE